MQRTFYVYLLTNWTRVLYAGITSNMARRMVQHLSGEGSTFVQRYTLRRLVHVETFATPTEAIRREKQIKGWVRRRKIELIEAANPSWTDLAGEWKWRPPLDSEGMRSTRQKQVARNCGLWAKPPSPS